MVRYKFQVGGASMEGGASAVVEASKLPKLNANYFGIGQILTFDLEPRRRKNPGGRRGRYNDARSRSGWSELSDRSFFL